MPDKLMGWPTQFRGGFAFDPSLVLYLPLYELDGAKITSKDAYGHLCTVAGATWGTEGRKFDGTDDQITIPNHKAFAFGTGDFSFECWIKTTESTNSNSIIDTLQNVGGNYFGFAPQVYGGLLHFYLADGDAGIPASTGVKVINDGTWKHIFVSVVRGKNAYTYINGILDNTWDISANTATATTASSALIGVSNVWTTTFLAATIGEIRLYNRAFSPGEIQRNYDLTKSRYS